MSSLPPPLYPYLYPARVHRAMDGDSAKIHVDQGFGTWRLCTVHPGAEKEARYPQGVYRLYGINTPELRGAERGEGLRSLARLNELLSKGAKGDSVFVATHKEREHGKYRYMVEILIPIEPEPLEFDPELEREHWLDGEDLEQMLGQDDGSPSTIRAMATEILWHRRQAGEGRMINANQVLLEEGLAKPYFGGRKK
jgi:endonuclease YncB( thermonuclease family)